MPWAHALYACDSAWWRAHNGAKDFHGLKITQDRGTPGQYPDVKRVRCRAGVHDMLFEKPGEIGGGGNGGFHAINLLFQFGVERVVGIGLDMNLVHGVHFHGRHPPGLNNPRQASVDKWRERLDAQRPMLDRLGLEFVIGSPNSALTAFTKLPLREALNVPAPSPQSP